MTRQSSVQLLSFVKSFWAKCVLAGLGLLLPLLPVHAAAVAIDSLSISNYSVSFSLTGMSPISRSGAIGPITVEMGSYQDPIFTSNSSGLGEWKIYSAGTAGAPPPPSGTVDAVAGTIEVDFSSLRGKFTIPLFGSYAVFDLPLWPLTTPSTSNSYNASTDAYTLNWVNNFSKTISLGPISRTINGSASIMLSGTVVAGPPVQQTPVPAAIWLFGSGMIGLGAMLRRKIIGKIRQ